MPYFATTYRYVADSADARDVARPAHRAYLADLTAEGKVLLSGPHVGTEPSALLVFQADSAADVRTLTDQDPFVLEGLVAEITVLEWEPVSGRLASQV